MSIGMRRGMFCFPVTAILSFFLSLAAPSLANAGEVYLNAPGGTFNLRITSMREIRYRTVVPQHYDYSCGAAAVATLLTYSYDRPTSEDEPFLKMIQHGDRRKIQKLGFSMLDMKNYLESLGYKVSGFRLTLDKLKQIAVPGVALVEINGYKHFIVIRAVDDRNVLFADPALGMQIMSRERFEEIWDRILLVIRNDLTLARAGFNEGAFTKVRPRAPVGAGVDGASYSLSVFSQQLFMRHLF